MEVQFDDFLVVSQSFARGPSAWPNGDFDWDRRVGFSDFLLLSENYGKRITDLFPQAEPGPELTPPWAI